MDVQLVGELSKHLPRLHILGLGFNLVPDGKGRVVEDCEVVGEFGGERIGYLRQQLSERLLDLKRELSGVCYRLPRQVYELLGQVEIEVHDTHRLQDAGNAEGFNFLRV